MAWGYFSLKSGFVQVHPISREEVRSGLGVPVHVQVDHGEALLCYIDAPPRRPFGLDPLRRFSLLSSAAATTVSRCERDLGLAVLRPPPGFAVDPCRVVVLVPPLGPLEAAPVRVASREAAEEESKEQEQQGEEGQEEKLPPVGSGGFLAD